MNIRCSLCVLVLVVAALIPAASAFTYSFGDNKTIYPRCVNATSGALLGTNANLTVHNESGTYYVVSSLPNDGKGLFHHYLTNLSQGHCYSLDFACKDSGTWQSQWATICVNQSDSSVVINQIDAGYDTLAGVLAAIAGCLLMTVLGMYFGRRAVWVLYLALPLSFMYLLIGANAALQGTLAGSASSDLSGGANVLFWLCITLLGLVITGCAVAFFIQVLHWMRMRRRGRI